MLNLALRDAKSIWTTIHVGDIRNKFDEAKKTLMLAEYYMDKLTFEAESLSRIKVSDDMVKEYIEMLIPMPDEPSKLKESNVKVLRFNLNRSYYEAPDLKHPQPNAWRFINAVSDFATHSKPLRQTANYKENLFAKTVEGNHLIDRAYELVKAI